MNKTLIALLFPVAALIVAGCATPTDSQRAQVRRTLTDAQALGSEIQTWRRGLTPTVSSSVVQTVQGFQDRAKKTLSELDDVSAETTTGLDLTAAKQALAAIVKFDTGPMPDASERSRSTILDQFSGLAASLETAVQRVQQSMVGWIAPSRRLARPA